MKQTLAMALERRGYDKLTPVQEAVTDPALGSADLLVSAQTGSGKTVGFGLAIAGAILGDEDRFGSAALPLALVIAPTRELALQVKRELSWLYGEAGATVASCVGGMDMRDERRALDRGAHIVVATPGRLRDHIMRGSIDLSELRAVVLDEADEMLDLGFREDLEFILGEAPEERQTLLFSATVPPAIAQLAKSYQRDAMRITTVAEKSQHSDIEYHAMAVAPRDDENAIINVLRFYEAPNAIVFCNTRAMVNRLVTRLSNRGFSVVALSGELSQSERSHALQAMRDGRARVCVATDVAARGIDLPNLDLVVHAELPSSHETLLHRSGRTGRAGRKGVSALIVPPKARKKAERLLKMAKLQAEWGNAPSAETVTERDGERMLADPAWHEAVSDSEQPMVTQLSEAFSAEQLAAAYLRLWRSARSAPEELSEANAKPEPREPFGPSVWFSIAAGRNEGADPRRLLPMLCRAGNITKSDIGAIRIQQDETFAEIRESSAAGFLAALGTEMVLDDGTKLTQLDSPPNIPAGRPAGRPGGPRKFDGPKPGGKRPHRGQDSRPDDRRGERSYDKPGFDKSDGPRKPRANKSDRDERPRHKKHEAAAPREPNAVVTPRSKPASKPAGKPDAGDASKSLRKKDGGKPHFATRGPKGPPPPKGKPNSKKNKARAALAKAGKGGSAKPRRPKS
ncbi:DEAD/DEAH box helicase [Phaeobacter gallaeciensis]|uniref:DEAD/DEAH box helicase n=1 Tax=Phaeobacter gallaeciensis TaxID=60890 RepID=UPI00237EEA57|nr:DEAD/DEAH box helicase [Phaeobacter gallaeciensis]MDE4305116.1 DEAD/DEAH box helicase [Phaeobacter gallaeciensis]MDE4309464.1 DEAD/DEAH box helicase [Phaeobacter gallaeciensis]MDE4313921.1 DEAD/DEAH box helicase [Phaeobacter gallaeciensis]MDE4318101.1 DEAD/DEAH box helicase [Phaeobacter gallaeciensis]MDE4323407.1 DEAD/DEAH box helicase [Phaeobacter gallaeciensis]